MKKIGLFTVIAVLVVGLAVYLAACGGGGGGSSSNNTVSYSNSTQAASSSNSANGAVSLTSTVGTATDAASGAIPTGYAPSRKARSLRAKAVNTDAIANIDPRLKDAVDKMMAELNHPIVGSALTKAKSLKSSSMLASSVSATVPCTSGNITIKGSENSTTANYDYTIDITFNNCQDGTGTYDLLTGSLHAHHLFSKSTPSTYQADVTATNLAIASYVTGSLRLTSNLNGTFNSTDNDTSGSDFANGTFKMTQGTDEFTFTMTNVTTSWTYALTASTETGESISNGSFNWAFTSGGTNLVTATIGLSNLDQKYAASSSGEDDWINGSISITWTPDLGSSCIPGTVTFTTTAPIHYPPAYSYCPTSGAVTVNNATIEYGKPSGVQVTITVGGTPQVFTDCELQGAGGACLL